MPQPWLDEILDHADRGLLAGGYAGVSVDTADVRRWLDAHRWPYVHPDRPAPSAAEVAHTAERTIGLTRRRSVLLAATVGLAGPVALPPEIAGTAVATLRLGQRLAVIHGFELEKDRGRMALWRALAAALDLELPAEGPVGIRLRDLPVLVQPAPRNVAAWLIRALVVRSVVSVTGVSRFVPVLSSGTGAWRAHKRTNEIGGRMCAIYRRMADADPLPGASDAEEVEPPGSA